VEIHRKVVGGEMDLIASKLNAAPYSARTAGRPPRIVSNTGWTSVGELEITRRNLGRRRLLFQRGR
jgi:hypothetical protein